MSLGVRRRPRSPMQSSLPREQQPSQLVYRELEARIAFDAAGAATADTTIADSGPSQDAGADATADTNHDTQSAENTQLAEALASLDTPTTNEIVFVDPSVEDVNQLIAGIDPAHEIIFLDPSTDGVEFMAQVLSERNDIDAIHIISHGDEGALFLGSSVLNLDSMNGEYADELAIFRDALTVDADILIYGCNFGAEETGALAVARLAQLTDADIAASDDTTGHESLGGDWELESRSGSIEAEVAVDENSQEAWVGLLDDTGWKSPSATGDDYSQWTNASNAYASDNADAREDRSGQQQDWYNFAFGVPNGATIDGIEVRIEGNNQWEANGVAVELSWDGGANYTSSGIQQIWPNSGSDSVQTISSSTELWGRTWSADDFSDSNFRIQLTKIGSEDYYDFQVDHIEVRVHYTVSTNNAPVITSNGGGATANINVAENTAKVADVTATDADISDTLTYSISGGADSSQFTINSSTGELSFVSAPNFESPTDVGGNNVYDVQVQVDDGNGGVDTQDIAVTVTDANDAPAGTPGIKGTPTEDQTLTADTSGISDEDGLGTFSYQWLRDGVSISGATASTYTLVDADVGAQISVQVTYTDGGGNAEGPLTSTQTAAVANVNDAPTGLPVISGTPTEDQTLTADTSGIADEDGLGAFSYQWLRDGVAIGGATASTYTLGDADVGAQISVQVTYTDGHGTAEGPLTSAQTAAVANINDAPTGSVSISGTPTEDQTLTASNTLADADGMGAVSYQWQRDGVNIAGATSSTYTLTDADVGTNITVVASYTDGNGTPESVTSAGTGPIANVNDAPTGLPTVTGTPTEDQTLTADTSGIADDDGLGAFSYQWLRDGVAIGGATASTYTLGDADVGTQISVQVTYTDGNGTAEGPLTSAQTAAVANVNDAPTGSVSISGTPTEDQTLTASNTLADADGMGAVSYQWQRDGVNIAGATNSTYTLADADVGANITVAASYTDGNGTLESVTSAGTGPIANVNDAPIITSDGGGATATVSVLENQSAVTTVAASDVDPSDTVNYSITGGADQALFSINSSSGALSFVSAPDYENPADSNTDNAYEVQVTAADGNGGFDVQTITVNVIDDADGIRVTPTSIVPIGDEVLVNTTTTDAQIIGANVSQAIAADANGNYVITWASNLQDGDGYGIYAQQYAADGTAIGGEFLVNTTTTDSQLNPTVAMDDAGNFVIAWQSNTQDGDNYGVYAQRYDSSGVAQGSEFLVNTTTVDYQGSPGIAMSSSGEFVIIWTSNGQEPDSSLGIYAQRFDASGVAQGGEIHVNTYTTGHQQVSSVSMDAEGNFVVTWASNGQDGSNYGVFAQRFDSNGNTVGAEFQVNTTTANSQLYNDVVMLDDGRFVVAYQSVDSGGDRDLFFQRYAADGSTIGGEIQVNTASDPYFPIPSVTADESGNITLVWNSSGDGAGNGVFARTYDWSGTALTGEIQVNTTTTGDQLYPDVVAQPGGGFIVVWSGNGPGDSDGIFAQQYGLATAEDGTTATFEIVLERAPTSTVTIPISVSDSSEASVSTSSLIFTAANWNTPQTVTITGLQDFTVDGDQTFSLNIGPATSTDANFNGLDPEDLKIINVEPPNAAPTITSNGGGPTANVNVAENQTAVTTVTSTDVDAGTPTYTISGGADAALFTINSVSGALSFISAPNFESPTDSGGNNVYDVQIQVSDGNGGFDTQDIAVTVTDANDTPTGTPSITGTAQENQTLTADTSGIADEDGLGAFSYQWLRDGVAIGGATASTYTLGDADVGAQISVQVTYTDGNGNAEGPLTSSQTAAVTNVNDTPTGSVTISGTPTEDQTLTASNTLADDDGMGAVSYQWQRDGVNIAGATNNTYTLTDADVGANITVVASYTDGNGTPESVASAGTGPIANVNDAPTGLPTVTGTPTEDQTLTADTSGIADDDGLGAFSYQWLRDGVAIGGATASTYTLGDTDVGAQISVQVTYTDGNGTAEGPLTSAQTAAVTNVNDAPTGSVTISGTPTEDQTLIASNTLADADGLGPISYQWQRDGVDIAGATNSTYTLADADVGTNITVVASYTDGNGTPESVASAGTGPIANVNDTPTGLPTVTGTPTENQTLTADTSGISDDDGLGAFSYQWLRDGVAIGGATASTYTLTNTDVGAQISVQVTYTDGNGTAEGPLTSTQTSAVTNVNDAPTGAVTISGTPTEDQTLTASNTLADADGMGAVSYQWQRDGVNIGGATNSTYTLTDADVGANITVVASYTDGNGTPESVASAGTGPIANVNDAPTGLPTISGTPTEDQTLTADTSGIADDDGLGTFSYQWLRDGVAIGGATASTYTLGDADVGAQISVQVTYTDGNGTAEGPLTSTQTAAVANVNDAPTGSVTISGTPTEDQTLTASNTLADADGMGVVSYQWQRDGVDIGGATAATYTLTDADVGANITVVASYTDGNGTLENVTSAGTGPIANVNDAPTGLPAISGTPTEDQTLTADTSGIADDDGLGAFSYQWLRDGVAIGGATASTYTLGDADVGAQISVQVTYTDGNGTAEGPLTSAQTAAVANVNDAPTGLPAISGSAVENQTLTADTSGIADDDGLGAFSYQWLRDGMAIGGATSGTYTLTNTDVGAQISVQVTYTDGNGTAEGPLTSAQTGIVTNVNDAPTGSVTISGTPTEDQTLTASNTLADADGLGPISYQWQRDGVDIAGATNSTYTLADADVGANITVVASYTDGNGTPESVTSAGTGPIANVNDTPTGAPVVTGTPTENQTLTANTSGIADDDGLGAFSYQWLRDGVAIGGATASTYTLGDADVGAQISVQVTYTDGNGTAEGPLTSAPTAAVANVNDAPTGSVSISGTPTEDQTLTASNTLADADGMGVVSYQWQRDAVDIAGANNSTYTLSDTDVGANITVAASYTDGNGTLESVTSAGTGPITNVNDAPTGIPAIKGAPAENQILAADTSGIADDDGLGAFSYQWLRDGSAIAGATSATYALTNSDVGAAISVQVAYTDGNASAELLTSSATGIVTGAAPAELAPAPVIIKIVEEPVIEIKTDLLEVVAEELDAETITEAAAPIVEALSPVLNAVALEGVPDPIAQVNNQSSVSVNFTIAENIVQTNPFILGAESKLFGGISLSTSYTVESSVTPDTIEISLDLENIDFQALQMAVNQTLEDISYQGGPLEMDIETIAIGTGTLLSAGTVTWLLRGGALLSSFLWAIPAWRGFDPLPIVTSRADGVIGISPDEEEESQAERLFDNAVNSNERTEGAAR